MSRPTHQAMLIALALLVAACVLVRLGRVARDHFQARFDLIFETPNLATIRMIQEGRKIYDPRVYNDSFFVLTMYTPAYHYLVAQLPTPRDHPFLAGRLASMAFMVLSAALLFLPGRPGGTVVAPILALAAFFSIRPVVSNTVFLRHDPMALFFAALAVVCAADRKRGVAGASLAAGCAAMAFLTKQSYLAAGIACAVHLAWTQRERALAFVATASGLVLSAAVAAYTWCGGRGVWFSLFVAPRNPLSLTVWLSNWQEMIRQPVFAALLVLAAVTSYAAVRREGLRLLGDSPYFAYLVASTLAALATTAKIGASTNCFFELVLAALLWLAFCARGVPTHALLRRGPLTALAAIVACEVVELSLASPATYSFANSTTIQEREREIDAVKHDLATLTDRDPKVLNLADVRLTYSVTDVCYLNDPVLYPLLWESGTLSDEPLREAIRRGAFDVILLPRDEAFLRASPWSRIHQAADASYRTGRVGVFRYLIPTAGAPHDRRAGLRRPERARG